MKATKGGIKMWYMDPDIPAIALFKQISCMMDEQAKRVFAKFDMKLWQAGILLALSGKELSQKELAERMNVTPSTITTSIQKMEREGYVVRCPDSKDQRVMRLSVTEKSHKYLENLGKVGEALDETVFSGMSMEEKIILKRLLMQVCDNLNKAEEEERERAAKEKMREHQARMQECEKRMQEYETKVQEFKDKMQKYKKYGDFSDL